MNPQQAEKIKRRKTTFSFLMICKCSGDAKMAISKHFDKELLQSHLTLQDLLRYYSVRIEQLLNPKDSRTQQQAKVDKMRMENIAKERESIYKCSSLIHGIRQMLTLIVESPKRLCGNGNFEYTTVFHEMIEAVDGMERIEKRERSTFHASKVPRSLCDLCLLFTA